MQTVRSNKTFRLALVSILSAIIFVQCFVPFFGYIPTPLFVIVAIHVTVIVGGVVMGPVEGAILGLIWGLITLFRAFVYPTNPIDIIVFTNPIISVLPRVLLGLAAGFLPRIFKKVNKKWAVMSITGVICSLINTIFVLGFIYIFYREPYANFYQMDVSKLLPALLVVVFTNGLAEAVLAGIATPVICRPLIRLYEKKRKLSPNQEVTDAEQ